MRLRLSGDRHSRGGVNRGPLSRSGAASAGILGPVSTAHSSRDVRCQTSTHGHREFAVASGGPLGDWSAISSAVVLLRSDLVAGAGLPARPWPVGGPPVSHRPRLGPAARPARASAGSSRIDCGGVLTSRLRPQWSAPDPSQKLQHGPSARHWRRERTARPWGGALAQGLPLLIQTHRLFTADRTSTLWRKESPIASLQEVYVVNFTKAW